MRLRALLTPFAGPNGVLPERFLTIEAADLVLTGWDSLGAAVGRHDRPGRPVNAVSIAFAWPGEDSPVPDAQGQLRPCIETNYYNDDAFPFSHSSRDDLLEGYSFDGCTWSGDPEATDSTIAVEGIDDLNAALAALEAKLLSSDEPDEADLRAGSLGACLLSALLLQAVTLRTERDGLPRPLCLTAGSNGVYPYFDTPVAGMPAEVLKANAAAEDVVPTGQDVPVPRYSSLLLTGIPRAKKRAVLVLEEPADDLAGRLTGLRNLSHPEREEIELPRATEPVTPAPEALEPEPPAAAGGLLLVKRPVKHSGDFRDMLGPRDSDLQQRLDSLLAGSIAPAVPAIPEPAAAVAVAVAEEYADAPDRAEEPGLADESSAAAPQMSQLAEEFEEPQADWPRVGRWARFKRWLSWFAP